MGAGASIDGQPKVGEPLRQVQAASREQLEELLKQVQEASKEQLEEVLEQFDDAGLTKLQKAIGLDSCRSYAHE